MRQCINPKYTSQKCLKLKENNENINILIVGIDNEYFNKDIDINNIPNKDFLINVCSQHTLYTKFNNNNSIKTYDERIHQITSNASKSNTDITDPIIENPEFTQINLFDYQRRTVKWMLDTELSTPTVFILFTK